MRLALLVCVSVVMLYKAEGTTTIFNQNKGLLRAFNGLNPEHENRDTEVLSVATTTVAVAAGVDVGLQTGTYTIFGEAIDVMVCFQTGFCEAAATANGAWAITSPPTEAPPTTGMATGHANVLFAPYVVPHDDAAYSYGMAYRPLDYTNDYNKHDIERLLAEKFDTTPEDKNTITDAMLANYKGFVVTWSIDNAAGSENSKFQLALLNDGTNTFVFYIYGAMGLTGITGIHRCSRTTAHARICAAVVAASTDSDAVLAEADLLLNSNFKCGNPGVYFFDVTDPATACGGTATDCSVAYDSGTAKPNCNATAAPVDSCLVTAYCSRTAADPNQVDLTVNFNWYRRQTNPVYMQALRYDIWQSNVAAAAEEQQQFVLKTGAPVTGTCGKTLADNEETISLTIDVTEADPENRCGITVDAGPPETLYFGFKIFEYTYDGATAADDFGPHGMIDKWGDWIITGKCVPDDLAHSVSVAVENNGPSTPTVLAARPRTLTMEVVDAVDDTGAQVLGYVQIGRIYYLRICLDHGTPFNPQADPFGIHTKSCSVSNKADFTVTDPAEDVLQEFIEEAAGESCPIANGDTTAPMFMNSDFKVRSDATDYPAYGTSDAGFPQNKWCIYTDKIIAARWNKFVGAALVDKLYLKCTVGFCAKFDFTATPSEGQKCIDNCAGVKRRRRDVANDTSPYRQEVVYTSVTYQEPATTEEICASDSSDFTIAIATVVTLIVLLSIAILAAILVFVKLMRAASRHQKEKQYK